MVNSWLAWQRKKFSELLFVWCLVSLHSQFGCVATWKDKPALGLYQWPCQIQDTGRHLNTDCFVSNWIPPPLPASRGTVWLSCAVGQALGEICMFQSTEARELCEAQLILKNSYKCHHQKTHWTNKISNNCHEQILDVLEDVKQMLPTVCWLKWNINSQAVFG